MSCLENIISINGFCGDQRTISLSGLDLFDAPEISARNLANITNETYINSKELATAKLNLARILVKNDLVSVMGANNIIPQVADQKLTCGEFRPSVVIEADATERGVTLFRNKQIRGRLRKLTIHTIKIYPLVSKESVTVKIYDDYASGMVSEYHFELTANGVNEFDVEYTVKGSYARVVMDGTDVPVASAYLAMCAGCNGTMPNDCGYTKSSYGGNDTNGKEGYGLLLDFSCKCDYEQLLCDLSDSYVGELVWLKTRYLLQEERMHSNRLNNYIVFGTEDAQATRDDIHTQYINKWNAFVNAAPQLLRTFRDDCLECRGARWVSNI